MYNILIINIKKLSLLQSRRDRGTVIVRSKQCNYSGAFLTIIDINKNCEFVRQKTIYMQALHLDGPRLKSYQIENFELFYDCTHFSPPPLFFVKYFVTSLARRMDLVPFNVFNLQMSSLI